MKSKIYENYYEVFEDGTIYSLKTNRFLKGHINQKGYISININGEKKLLHRVIIEAFRGESDLTTDHINGKKTDNRIENLEYVTRAENTRRMIKRLGYPPGIEKAQKACIKTRSKKVIYRGEIYPSGAELCRKLELERHAVSNAIKQGTKIHGYSVYYLEKGE